MTDWQDISTTLVEHSRQIIYHPLLNQITDHVLASILLQQILYRWGQNGAMPFYKFAAPCNHFACRAGDSWQEELGFSRTEFETARRRIGVKISRGQQKKVVQETSLVTYWTDNQRLTWYALNEALLAKKLQAFTNVGKLRNSGNAETLQYLNNAETMQDLGNAEKLQLGNAEKLHLEMQDPNISLVTERSTEKIW